jgi:hypothetical protein
MQGWQHRAAFVIRFRWDGFSALLPAILVVTEDVTAANELLLTGRLSKN